MDSKDYVYALEASNIFKKHYFKIVLITGVILLYLGAYFMCPSTPTVNQAGWWGWSDQSLYMQSVAALARFDFRPEIHFYPIGYPAMGAIFYRVMPLHPMLVPNAFFVIVIIVLLYHIYRRFISTVESMILTFATIFLHKSILTNLVIPWSTIPTHALTYVIIYLMLFRQYKAVNVVVSYIAGTVIFLCRPGDVLFVVPCFVFNIVNVEDKAEIPSRFITAVLSFLPLLGGVLTFNKLFYDSYVLTPYLTSVSGTGFSFNNFLYKTYIIFIESYSFSGLSYGSLLGYFPWFVIILPGLLYAVKRYGWKILILIVSLLAPLLFYISYNDCDYSTIFKYLVIHYINWTFPLWALFAYMTVRYAWDFLSWRVFSFSLILPIVIALFIRLDVVKINCNCDIYTVSQLQSYKNNQGYIIKYTGGDKTILKVKFNHQELVNGFYLPGWPWGDNTNMSRLTIDNELIKTGRDYKIFNSSVGGVVLFNRSHSFNILELSVNTSDYKTFTLYRPEFFRLRFAIKLPSYSAFRLHAL
ncbi:conserved hypothetical protein, membrane [Candidatus Magnetobacterium bavaricum]|uniref:Glycosyltransferase RgtA/B/C/D-like domain-containing protein n=1 Tax=Candidatus Magnetobacterium bavaricum TaxID=29290 RepID=A0A0F3GYA1_9BACT|nr:conserved hypothetical protein, membrane [Candidatus Magnetobacterium bavaricum]